MPTDRLPTDQISNDRKSVDKSGTEPPANSGEEMEKVFSRVGGRGNPIQNHRNLGEEMGIIQNKMVRDSWLRQQDVKREKIGLRRGILSNQEIKKRMNELNKRKVKSEQVLERELSRFAKKQKLNFKLRKNWPILNQYFGDFVCIKEKIIIEADGSFHNSNESKQYDKKRDDILGRAGWTVIRVSIPSMSGIGKLYKTLLTYDRFKIKDRKRYKKNRDDHKQKELNELYQKANQMLVGCKIDLNLFKKIEQKKARIEKIRKNYIKHGIDPAKFL